MIFIFMIHDHSGFRGPCIQISECPAKAHDPRVFFHPGVVFYGAATFRSLFSSSSPVSFNLAQCDAPPEFDSRIDFRTSWPQDLVMKNRSLAIWPRRMIALSAAVCVLGVMAPSVDAGG
jgi:hypothetical protein